MSDKEIYTLVAYQNKTDVWQSCVKKEQIQIIWKEKPEIKDIREMFWQYTYDSRYDKNVNIKRRKTTKYKVIKFKPSKKQMIKFILDQNLGIFHEGNDLYEGRTIRLFMSIPAESIDMYEHWDLIITEQGERKINYGSDNC